MADLPHKSAKLIEILRDKDIRKFACGERHSCALTTEGALYTWGYGGDGQLGHGDYQVRVRSHDVGRMFPTLGSVYIEMTIS